MIPATKSPMTTHAYNPNALTVPEWQYDLVEWIPIKGKKGFETIAAARGEDRKRARSLMRSGDPDAQQLGQWLATATDQRLLPLSPASSFYMRVCRRKLLGGVMKAIYEGGLHDGNFVTFTLIHPAWFYSAGDLHNADPKAIRKQLRRWLELHGVIGADGLMFCSLHGEFNGSGYQLHYHGIASSSKARLILTLYGQFGFTSTEDIQQPVQCKDAYNLGGWLSYCLKSYWPSAIKYIGEDGKVHKGRKQHLQPAQHEEFLMWMSRQRLLSLLMYSGFSTRAPWGRLGMSNLGAGYGFAENASI